MKSILYILNLFLISFAQVTYADNTIISQAQADPEIILQQLQKASTFCQLNNDTYGFINVSEQNPSEAVENCEQVENIDPALWQHYEDQFFHPDFGTISLNQIVIVDDNSETRVKLYPPNDSPKKISTVNRQKPDMQKAFLLLLLCAYSNQCGASR